MTPAPVLLKLFSANPPVRTRRLVLHDFLTGLRSHVCRSGHPSRTHSSMSARRHLTDPITRRNGGSLPAEFIRRIDRALNPSSSPTELASSNRGLRASASPAD